MEFIKKYNPKHYNYYLKKAEGYMNEYTTINAWIKNLYDEELVIWICNLTMLENDDSNYYEENSILLTILIKIFITELDVETDKIGLKNSEIEKLVLKFKHILSREYSNRKKIGVYKNEKYSLLK